MQRVGIAQALINDPEVVFLDEPMSGLDPLGRREVRNLILSLRDRGCTVFFSSHVLVGCRSAVQPRRHPGRRQARRERAHRRSSGVRGRGWELVVSGRDRRVARAPSRARAARRRRSASTGTRSSCRSSRRPSCCLRDLVGGGAQLVSLNPIRETLEDFFVKKVARAGELALVDATGGVMTCGVIRTIAVSVFRESVRDKVLYNLVFFAVLLIARVVSAEPADRRTGHQDHQGSRPRGDVAVRAVHRGVHRHRPGVEGSREAQHLCAAREADSAAGIRRRQIPGPGADAVRQPRDHGRGVLRRARRGRLDRRRLVPPALGSACARSGAAEGHRHDLSAARDRGGAWRCSFPRSRARCWRRR